MDAILSRRSIRKYTSKPLSEAEVKHLLEAAMCAPSAGNEQTWEFVVIRDRKILEEITKVHPHSQMLKEAPVAILVCGDLKKEIYGGMWIQDCSAATENILIAANAKSLGAVWLGVYPMHDRVEGIRKVLEIPDHIVPLALIPVGHPAEKKPPADRFDAARIHNDRW